MVWADGASAACVASELVDLSSIVIEIPPHLGERISSKFLQKSIGEHKSNHRFADNSGRGDDAPVGALVSGLHRLFGDHIGGAEGAAERGDRLEVTADNDVFAVGDAAFEPASAIGAAAETPGGFVVGNFVLHFAAVGARGGYARADFHGFDGLDAHHGLRQTAVEFFIPLRVAAEAHGNLARDDFEDAADGVAGLERGVDLGFHFVLRGGIHAAQRRINVGVYGEDFVPGGFAVEFDVADLNRVAGDFCAELPEQQLCQRSGSYAGGGFAGGSTLEDVTGVVKIKFLRAGEVGMTRARSHELLVVAGEVWGVLDGEGFLPIGPVAVFDAQRDGRADGFAVAHAGKDFGAVFLDFLTAAAAVAELAAVQFVIDEIEIDRQGSRQAGDEGEERLSVGFTGGVEAKHGRFGRSSVAVTWLRVQRGEEGHAAGR